MINENSFVWFLIGDVILTYVAWYVIKLVVDKVWWSHVDRVLEGPNQKAMKPKAFLGGDTQYRIKNVSA